MGNCTKKGVSTLGKAITVASGKGGTGKTSLTAMRYGLDTSVHPGDTVRFDIPDLAAVLCESDADEPGEGSV